MTASSSKLPFRKLDQRRRLFTASVSLRNKRRTPNRQYTPWPVIYTDVICGAAFLGILSYFLIDELAARAVGALPSGASDFFRLITDIGKSEWILIPTGVFCLVLVFFNWQALPGRWQARLSGWLFDAWFLFVAVAGSGILINLLKFVFGRARPKHLEALEFGYFAPFSFESSFASFPSGHSTTIAALATFLALRFPKYTVVFAMFALLIGASRVFVGAHYPSDVILGLTTGVLFTLVLARVFAIRKIGFRFVDIGGDDRAVPRRHVVRGIKK